MGIKQKSQSFAGLSCLTSNGTYNPRVFGFLTFKLSVIISLCFLDSALLTSVVEGHPNIGNCCYSCSHNGKSKGIIKKGSLVFFALDRKFLALQ